MDKNKIISKLKEEYGEYCDAALLLNISPEQFGKEFHLSDSQKDIIENSKQTKPENLSKNEVLFYLCVKWFQESKYTYFSGPKLLADFYNSFWEDWMHPFKTIQFVFKKALEAIDVESINENDLVYVNILSRDEVKIFIITQQHLIQLYTYNTNEWKELYVEPLIKNTRTQNIIQRDIKKILASDNSVWIYFHGVHSPTEIQLKDYASTVKLQSHITELRAINPNYKGNNPRR